MLCMMNQIINSTIDFTLSYSGKTLFVVESCTTLFYVADEGSHGAI